METTEESLLSFFASADALRVDAAGLAAINGRLPHHNHTDDNSTSSPLSSSSVMRRSEFSRPPSPSSSGQEPVEELRAFTTGRSEVSRPQSPSSPGQETVKELRDKYDLEREKTTHDLREAAELLSDFLAAADVTASSPGPGFFAVDLSGVRRFAMAAVRVNGLALQHANSALRDDRDLCLAACDETDERRL